MDDTRTGVEVGKARSIGVEIGRLWRRLTTRFQSERPTWHAPLPDVNLASTGRHHRAPGGVKITRQMADGRVLAHYDSRSEREATLTTMVRPVETEDWPDGGVVTMEWPADRAG